MYTLGRLVSVFGFSMKDLIRGRLVSGTVNSGRFVPLGRHVALLHPVVSGRLQRGDPRSVGRRPQLFDGREGFVLQRR